MATEREELIGALQQITAFAEGLLALSERLVVGYTTDERPTAQELADMRAGVARWREQLAGFRQRLTALSIEPPARLQ
jgi:hypothetical protein